MIDFDEAVRIITDKHHQYWYNILLGQNDTKCVKHDCANPGNVYLMIENGITSHLGLLCEECIKIPRTYSTEQISQEDLEKLRFLWNLMN